MKENAKRIQKNDMVLIHNDGPQLQWRLGKVKELLVSSDGEVRGAKIETVTPGYKSVVLERPLQLLYPLEVSAYEEKEVEQNGGRDAKELEQGDEKDNLVRETTDRSGSKIAEEERMNDSYAELIEEIDEIDSDSEKSSEDMINDCYSERFREEIEGDFEILDLPETVKSKDEKFERQKAKEKRTEEERRVGWLSGVSDFPGGKTQIVDPSSQGDLVCSDERQHDSNEMITSGSRQSSSTFRRQRPRRKAAVTSNVQRRLMSDFGTELDDILQGGSVKD